MPLTLHLVRHGRTVYNTEHRFQGWCDSPITSFGLEGVRETAAALADVPFVAAYASPLGRTVATAREILRFHPGLRLVTDADLRELNFGELEGALEAPFWAEHDHHEFWTAMIDGSHPGLPGGESSQEFRTRAARAFDRIAAAHPDGDVLVVAHGALLRMHLTLTELASGVTPTATPLANASVSRIVIDNGAARVAAVGEVPEPALVG
ncbi:histidine phosphatase family protein [Demequina pelophila]|uniref:histidine phosphatase family protein n=1 Tax=Demequina pelophila TaxID=1638984 RepID=UPI00078584A2|nr:histidine phosphatase family protein [Demequina pelophila]